jgi:alpha-ketoglutarate-dependent taurine dioxygenase
MDPFGIMISPKTVNQNLRKISVKLLKELFNQYQLILLRGFETFTNGDELTEYASTWGEVSRWPFGTVLELTEHKNAEDHIFDHSYVPLHWDGMYRPQVPEYQIFQCVKAPGVNEGGRTTFSHTMLALKNAPQTLKYQWEKMTGFYQREMEFYQSKTISPIIVKHPYKDYHVIRYNEPPQNPHEKFINPPKIAFTGIKTSELEKFYSQIRSILYADTNYYAHHWQEDDMVIADNFSLLHGRESFISQAPRHLRRVQVLSNPPLDNPGLEAYQ